MPTTRASRVLRLACLGPLVVAAAGCALTKKPDAGACRVVVGAASSLSTALDELGPGIAEAARCDDVSFTYGSSGTLAAQVREGAPVDVLVVVGESSVESAGLEPSDSRVVALNRAAILVSRETAAGGTVADLADLADPSLVVALCSPDAPCGATADRVLARAAALWSMPSLSRAGIADTEALNADDLVSKIAMGEVDAAIGYANACVTSRPSPVVCIDIPLEVDGGVLGESVEYRAVVARPGAGASRVLAALTARAFVDRLVAEFGFVAP